MYVYICVCIYVCMYVCVSGIEGFRCGLSSTAPYAGSHSSIGTAQVQAHEDGTYMHTYILNLLTYFVNVSCTTFAAFHKFALYACTLCVIKYKYRIAATIMYVLCMTYLQ